MNKYQQFVKKHENDITSKQVNLTPEQVEMIQAVADMADVSFENMAMIMLHTQLKRADEWIIKQQVQKKARLN